MIPSNYSGVIQLYIYIYIHLVSKEHLMNLGMKAINGECTEYQSGEQWYAWHPVSFISSFEERSIGYNNESDEAT